MTSLPFLTSLRPIVFTAAFAVMSVSARADAVITLSDSVTNPGPTLKTGEANAKTVERLLTEVRATISENKPYENSIPLTDFPTWGKNVPGASGVVDYRGHFPGGFVCHVALSGLAPKHFYKLTLNGNPERAGNDRLKSPVPGNEKERYYDFEIIMTDAGGNFSSTYAIALIPGDYDARFYVKDTTDFKIVLYHDFFPFKVDE